MRLSTGFTLEAGKAIKGSVAERLCKLNPNRSLADGRDRMQKVRIPMLGGI